MTRREVLQFGDVDKDVSGRRAREGSATAFGAPGRGTGGRELRGAPQLSSALPVSRPCHERRAVALSKCNCSCVTTTLPSLRRSTSATLPGPTTGELDPLYASVIAPKLAVSGA